MGCSKVYVREEEEGREGGGEGGWSGGRRKEEGREMLLIKADLSSLLEPSR